MQSGLLSSVTHAQVYPEFKNYSVYRQVSGQCSSVGWWWLRTVTAVAFGIMSAVWPHLGEGKVLEPRGLNAKEEDWGATIRKRENGGQASKPKMSNHARPLRTKSGAFAVCPEAEVLGSQAMKLTVCTLRSIGTTLREDMPENEASTKETGLRSRDQLPKASKHMEDSGHPSHCFLTQCACISFLVPSHGGPPRPVV